MSSLYFINVRPENGLFRLYNHDFPAGDRLIKHDGFPLLTRVDWTRYTKEPDAQLAARKLQAYLDKENTRKAASSFQTKEQADAAQKP